MTIENEMAVRRLMSETASQAADAERFKRIEHAVPTNAGAGEIKVRADDVAFLVRLARRGLNEHDEELRKLTLSTMELVNPRKTS